MIKKSWTLLAYGAGLIFFWFVWQLYFNEFNHKYQACLDSISQTPIIHAKVVEVNHNHVTLETPDFKYQVYLSDGHILSLGKNIQAELNIDEELTRYSKQRAEKGLKQLLTKPLWAKASCPMILAWWKLDAPDLDQAFGQRPDISWKYQIFNKLLALTGDINYSYQVVVMTLGKFSVEQSIQEQTREIWDLYVQTGTIHLMVVSGLHASVLTGFLLLALKALVSIRYPWITWLVASLVMAVYAYLTDFSTAVVRVYAMSLTGLWLTLLLRQVPLSWLLGIPVIFTLLLTPGTLLTTGFILSYGLVAVILFIWWEDKSQISWSFWQFLKFQWVITVFSFPLILITGVGFSIGSLVTNLVAVPIFSVTLPLHFLALLSLEFELSGLLAFSRLGQFFLDSWLQWFTQVWGDMPMLFTPIDPWPIAISCLVVLILCYLPKGLHARSTIMIWIAFTIWLIAGSQQVEQDPYPVPEDYQRSFQAHGWQLIHHQNSQIPKCYLSSPSQKIPRLRIGCPSILATDCCQYLLDDAAVSNQVWRKQTKTNYLIDKRLAAPNSKRFKATSLTYQHFALRPNHILSIHRKAIKHHTHYPGWFGASTPQLSSKLRQCSWSTGFIGDANTPPRIYCASSPDWLDRLLWKSLDNT